MSIIKIYANTIELDIVYSTLNIKQENNAFITDFKVAHSSYPFLVIENEKTIRALGTRDITSVLKKKVVPVIVYEMGEQFYGELQTLSYPSGFRKCNIKYGVEPLAIMDKKLLDLLPVLSVLPGEENPVPFTEESLEVIDTSTFWYYYPLPFIGKIYPEVKFQFPQMAWKDKYFEGTPEEDDPWYNYFGYYNYYDTGTLQFAVNDYLITGESGENIEVHNRNVPSPQLFLLSILEYAFATIGYAIAGDFITHELIKRVLVLSTANNLCKVNIAPTQNTFVFSDLEDLGLFIYRHYAYELIPTVAGTYTFRYDITETLKSGGVTNSPLTKLVYQLGSDSFISGNTTVYYNYNDPDKLHFTGSFDIVVDESDVGKLIRVMWLKRSEMPHNPQSLTIQWSNESKDFYMMHPTLQLGRYAPQMTLSDYINEIKNKFGLSVVFDSVGKVAYFNFSDASILQSNQYVINKSLAISEHSPPDTVAFILKNSNEEDNSLYIDKAGAALNKTSSDEFIQVIESKFKVVGLNGLTADLSATAEKDGTGLMIYNPDDTIEGFQLPVITSEYNGQTLEWDGAFGLYNSFHKKSIHFRLNASSLEMSGPFTESEIRQIAKNFKVHIDNQTYIILSMEYEPTLQDNYKVKLTLMSVNF